MLPVCFFFKLTATIVFDTLSLHDALPIYRSGRSLGKHYAGPTWESVDGSTVVGEAKARSEEHTSELQSLTKLVCRLLLEKKKGLNKTNIERLSKRIHVYHAVVL